MDSDAAPDPASLDSMLVHRAFVEDLARRLAHDDATADDVAQRTWLAAMRSPPSDERRVRSWLSRVVRNLVLERRRETGRRRRREEHVARPETLEGTAETVARADAYKRLVIAVMDLDEPYRSTVLLRYFEDLPPRDVARRLGVPVETVRSRLRRSADRLRARLDDESGGRAAWAPLFLGAWPLPGSGSGTGTTASAATSGVATGGLAAGGGLALAKSKTIGLIVATLVLLAIGGVAVNRASAPSSDGGTNSPTQLASDPGLGAPSPRDGSATTPEGAVADATPDDVDPLPDPVDLSAVDRDRDLHGRVIDSTGVGIPGAVLSSWFRPWSESQQYFLGNDVERAGPSTRSASDGTFRLRLEPGDVVWLRVSAQGRPERLLPARCAGERTDIVLGEGVELRVTLNDATGGPVAGFPLRLYRSHVGDEVFEHRGSTDASGKAVFAGLPPGLEAYVVADAEAVNRIERTRVTLPMAGHLALALATSAGRRVRGRVVSAEGGVAVSGARVTWRLLTHAASTSGADGGFELLGWGGEPGPEVEAQAPGFVSGTQAAGLGDDVVIRLRRALVVSGRVVDREGEPIADARVSLYGISEDRHVRQRSRAHVVTDADGRFRADTTDPALAHALMVEAHGHARLLRELEVGASDLGDVPLATPRRVEGVIRVEGGGPVTRIQISLAPVGQLDSSHATHVGRIARYSDDLGRFRFHDLCPGTYFLASMGDGYPSVGRNIEVPADGDLVGEDLVLPPLRPVTAQVVDLAGRGLPGIWVMTQTKGVSPSSGRTDAQGRTVVHVPVGTESRVYAIPRGADEQLFVRPPPVPLAADVHELTIELEAASPVTGTLTDVAGKPVARAVVEVTQSGQPSRHATTDAAGRFVASTSGTGSVTLRFNGLVRGHPMERDTGLHAELKDVAPGTRDVVLRAVPRADAGAGGSLVVRVVDPDGTPVAGASVVVFAEGTNSMRTLVTGSDGRATLSDAPDVEHSVSTTIRGDWYASRHATARPGDGEVVLAYRAAIVIEGEVVNSSGVAVTTGEAQARRNGRLVCGNPVLDDGTFRLTIPADEADGLEVSVLQTDGAKPVRTTGKWDGRSRVRIVVGD